MKSVTKCRIDMNAMGTRQKIYYIEVALFVLIFGLLLNSSDCCLKSSDDSSKSTPASTNNNNINNNNNNNDNDGAGGSPPQSMTGGDKDSSSDSSHVQPCTASEADDYGCLNSGVCSVVMQPGGGRSRFCKCTSKWTGTKCELRNLQSTAQLQQGSVNGVAIGVGVGIAVLVVIVAVIIFLAIRHNQRNGKKMKLTETKSPNVYDISTIDAPPVLTASYGETGPVQNRSSVFSNISYSRISGAEVNSRSAWDNSMLNTSSKSYRYESAL